MLDRRVAGLVARFDEIARTRMAGVPVANPALRVEAIGFSLQAEADGTKVAAGILLTPWFMSLVRLPLHCETGMAGAGQVQQHAFGRQVFEFIGGHEALLGAYAACSLFSPMFEFADQDSARAMALAVLEQLQPQTPPPAPNLAARRCTSTRQP